MSVITADILAGAYASSELVTVGVAEANGTVVVIYRGEFFLGSSTVTDGVAEVAVPPLASGDIIQASVTERGNQCGIPIRVDVNPLSKTGWVKPDLLEITNDDGDVSTISASAYAESYGETAGAIYDPLSAGATQLPADYDKLPIIELGFDIQTIQQAGTTSVRIVPRSGEGLLVGWNGDTPSSPAPLVLTTSATVSVTVERDDNPGSTLTRSFSVIVLPEPTYPSAPLPGDIVAACYRNYGGGYIRAMINCKKPCEAVLTGFDSVWKTGTARDPDFIEVDWAPVPGGSYPCSIRVIGETDPANYTNFIITVS